MQNCGLKHQLLHFSFQICANQADATEDFVYRLHGSGGGGQKLSQEQGRTNVITEILQAERDYVQNLQDVVIVSTNIALAVVVMVVIKTRIG